MYYLEEIKIIIIGGSSGSLPVLIQLIRLIPPSFMIPVIIVVHRQKNSLSELLQIFASANPAKRIVEPDDKQLIDNKTIYLAPQNYHLLVEKGSTFSLDYSEAVMFSRPSIDVTFQSAAGVFKNRLLAILLSGSNTDGTAGLQSVVANGGVAIAQDPQTALSKEMPLSAIEKIKDLLILTPENIFTYINSIGS